MITKEMVIDKLSDYLHRQISQGNLVDWAENAMMNESFDDRYHNEIRNAISRLGVADVRAFGLTWEDCRELLESLGYTARVEIVSR